MKQAFRNVTGIVLFFIVLSCSQHPSSLLTRLDDVTLVPVIGKGTNPVIPFLDIDNGRGSNIVLPSTHRFQKNRILFGSPAIFRVSLSKDFA